MSLKALHCALIPFTECMGAKPIWSTSYFCGSTRQQFCFRLVTVVSWEQWRCGHISWWQFRNRLLVTMCGRRCWRYRTRQVGIGDWSLRTCVAVMLHVSKDGQSKEKDKIKQATLISDFHAHGSSSSLWPIRLVTSSSSLWPIRFVWRGVNIDDVTIHPSRGSRIKPTLKVQTQPGRTRFSLNSSLAQPPGEL